MTQSSIEQPKTPLVQFRQWLGGTLIKWTLERATPRESPSYWAGRDAFRLKRNVFYSEAADPYRSLDVYTPTAVRHLSVVFFVHGGLSDLLERHALDDGASAGQERIPCSLHQLSDGPRSSLSGSCTGYRPRLPVVCRKFRGTGRRPETIIPDGRKRGWQSRFHASALLEQTTQRTLGRGRV